MPRRVMVGSRCWGARLMPHVGARARPRPPTPRNHPPGSGAQLQGVSNDLIQGRHARLEAGSPCRCAHGPTSPSGGAHEHAHRGTCLDHRHRDKISVSPNQLEAAKTEHVVGTARHGSDYSKGETSGSIRARLSKLANLRRCRTSLATFRQVTERATPHRHSGSLLRRSAGVSSCGPHPRAI